jgi:hypothetical protein
MPLRTHYALVRFPWFSRSIREALGAEYIGEHRIELQTDSREPVDVCVVLDASSEVEARERISRALAAIMTVPSCEVLHPPADGRGYIRICANVP